MFGFFYVYFCHSFVILSLKILSHDIFCIIFASGDKQLKFFHYETGKENQSKRTGKIDIDYMNYFDFEDGVSVKSEYNLDYFLDLNSVKLKTEQEHNFYKKHQTACRILNELMNHPDNEYEALDKLFYFNMETKEFEMSIEAYSPGIFQKK